MKKIYLTVASFLVVLFSSITSSAQITITSSDIASANDTFRVSMGVAFTGMNAATTGANHNWDFSQLTAASQTIDTFVSVASTGLYAFYFLGSSFAEKSNTSAVNLGIITIDYQYDFYKKSTSAYVETGVGANLSGFPIGIVNNPKDTIYRLPLHYDDLGSCSSAFSVSIPGLGYYGGFKTRVDTVDGWGTLTTPYGTFPVVRVKSVVNETDSIHIDTLGINIPPIPRPEVIEYKWLGTAQGIPLLQINTTFGAPTQIMYRDSAHLPVGINVMENQHVDFNVYPNPAADKIVIEYDLIHPAEVSADIFSLLGEKIFSVALDKKQPGKQFLPVDLSGKNISAGTYLVKLTVDGKTFQKQLVVRK